MSKKKLEKNKNSKQVFQIVELTIPRMGEGLQEARIIKLIKQPGDDINQDEIIYEMETDKAVVGIESPYAGRLVEWLVEEQEVLPIGACLAKIEVLATSTVEGEVKDCFEITLQEQNADRNFEKDESRLDIRSISPRVRTYCRKHNLSPEFMLVIPHIGKKLTMEDVDNYLKNNTKNQKHSENFQTVKLSQQQQALNYRFKCSAEAVVPATLVSLIDLNHLNQAMQTLLTDEQQNFISEFQVFAYVVGKAAAAFPKFRSALADSKTTHEYKHINLGIAVQTMEKELLTAVIPEADKLDFNSFIKTMQTQIEQAFNGKDQATEHQIHLILSYMGTDQIIFGAPVLVSPAVAILFLGAVLPYENKRLANLSLTFDHRVINGMDAAQFLSAIVEEISHVSNIRQANQNSYQTHLEHLKEDSGNLKTFKIWLLHTLGKLLAIDPQQIDLTEPLGLQGIDSIKAATLSSELEKYFNTKIPVTLLWNYPTYKSMFEYFSQRFYGSKSEEQNHNDEENLTEILRSLQNLSSEELKEILINLH